MTQTSTNPRPRTGRLPTGVSGLDTVLDGGLPRGGLYLAVGTPGTGKTTFANQMAFAATARGEHAAYITLMSENQLRMLSHLQDMSFFDPTVVGSSLHYVAGEPALRARGLDGLLDLIRRVLEDSHASVLVIDGFMSAQASAESPVRVREFLAALHAACDFLGCTTLLLSTPQDDPGASTVHSMVDGVLVFTLTHAQLRVVRCVEARKLRGSNHFLGEHDLEISSSGLIVRPRTELLVARYGKPSQHSDRRLSSGIPELDSMLGGGVLSGTNTMLLGFSGSGKTLLAAHFLEAGAVAGENVLHFGFYESPDRFVAGARSAGIDLAAHLESGRVSICWQPPMKYGLDALGERLFDELRRSGARRLVIDGLDGFRQSTAHQDRVIRFITAVVNELRCADVTTYITEETRKLFGPEMGVRLEGMSALVDNIFLLEYVEQGAELRRLLSIAKQRGSRYDTSMRELWIGNDGVRLAPDTASAALILSNHTLRPPNR